MLNQLQSVFFADSAIVDRTNHFVGLFLPCSRPGVLDKASEQSYGSSCCCGFSP
jgi:hypothetical protein